MALSPSPRADPSSTRSCATSRTPATPPTDTLNVGSGDAWVREGAEAPNPAPQPSDQVAQPTEAEVTELLNGFLEARIAGEGAEEYLLTLSEAPDVLPPLLYATTSGAPYGRAEFEPVAGIKWPYGWMAFKVRLFAGDTGGRAASLHVPTRTIA